MSDTLDAALPDVIGAVRELMAEVEELRRAQQTEHQVGSGGGGGAVNDKEGGRFGVTVGSGYSGEVDDGMVLYEDEALLGKSQPDDCGHVGEAETSLTGPATVTALGLAFALGAAAGAAVTHVAHSWLGQGSGDDARL
jgi:hypothetical protein